jgi:hypothetical protein
VALVRSVLNRFRVRGTRGRRVRPPLPVGLGLVVIDIDGLSRVRDLFDPFETGDLGKF